jgi:hypothetical protein
LFALFQQRPHEKAPVAQPGRPAPGLQTRDRALELLIALTEKLDARIIALLEHFSAGREAAVPPRAEVREVRSVAGHAGWESLWIAAGPGFELVLRLRVSGGQPTLVQLLAGERVLQQRIPRWLGRTVGEGWPEANDPAFVDSFYLAAVDGMVRT